MYSPKIREDFVPRIHQAAREAGIPMTRWVNDAVETALADPRQINGEKPMPSANKETTRRNPSTARGGQRP